MQISVGDIVQSLGFVGIPVSQQSRPRGYGCPCVGKRLTCFHNSPLLATQFPITLSSFVMHVTHLSRLVWHLARRA